MYHISKNFLSMMVCFNHEILIDLPSLFILFNILTSGWWSITITSFSHLRVKIHVLCRAQTITTNSPSITAYWDLALQQKADQTIDTLQPSLQQSKLRFLYWQYFCLSQNPIPVVNQSLSRVVRYLGSKVWIPSMHDFAIFSLICLKICKSWESQKKFFQQLSEW